MSHSLAKGLLFCLLFAIMATVVVLIDTFGGSSPFAKKAGFAVIAVVVAVMIVAGVSWTEDAEEAQATTPETVEPIGDDIEDREIA